MFTLLELFAVGLNVGLFVDDGDGLGASVGGADGEGDAEGM